MSRRVLHLLGTAQPESTGMARIVAALARGLAPRGYALHAWFMSGGGPLRADLERAGARVAVFPWEGGSRDPVAALRFFRALRRTRFDVVHQHTLGRAPRLLARMGGAKVVLHLHGQVVERNFQEPRFGAQYADLVVATSRAVGERANSSRVAVVYPGVELPDVVERPPAGTRPLTLGFAGRLVAAKGIAFLLHAVARLRQEFPSVRLEIAGAGPERPVLEGIIESEGLAESVLFLDWQTEITSVLRTWDVFVLPSLHEGFGIAALEAMSCGLPVVATSVGGLPELVENGRTGLLVPAADSAALAAALASLLRDPQRRRAMGDAARQRAAEQFSVPRMVNEVAAIYDDLLGAIGSK